MKFFKTPAILRGIYPAAFWRGSVDKLDLYLTFDDGPVPGATEYVLDILASENIKATFFCVGENVKKYPEIFHRILHEGHNVGNHTYNHLNSWKTPLKEYLGNIEKCEEVFRENGFTNRDLIFRPPYGRLSYAAYNKLKISHKIIMWDVLSYDFAKNIDPGFCLSQTKKYTSPGSIVVFHDSNKTLPLLKLTISKYISHFKGLEYNFSSINNLFLNFYK